MEMKIFDFGNANEKQKEAIMTTEGPLLLIAGPGTGKTFTLIKRIAYLIKEKNVNLKNIMAVTFTEKAAKELISRLTEELISYDIEIDVNDMYIGTFHQICLKIIKEFRDYTPLDKNYDMMDDFDTKYFVHRHISDFDMFDDLYEDKTKIPSRKWDKAERIINIVSHIIEEVDEPNELLLDDDEKIKAAGFLVAEYRELLIKENVLDFSSILSYCYKLLNEHEDARNILKERIKYIIVDEYQDTNKIQEKILFSILDENKNICVVGDDDQGLYRFRGATITNILKFTTNFDEGECKEIYLVNNYRSNQKIVDFYNNFMVNTIGFKWNGSRFEDKKIIASKKGNDKRETVVKCFKKGTENWYKEICNFIKKLQNEKVISDYNQIAFLANSISGDKITGLINYLEKNSIPCYAPRSKQFFDRPEIKLIIGGLIFCFPGFADKIVDEKYIMADAAKKYYIGCAKYVKDQFNKNKEKYAPFINYLVSSNKKFQNVENKLNLSISDIVYEFFQFEPFSSFLDMKNVNNVHDERPVRNISLFTQFTTQFERIYHIDYLKKDKLEKTLNRFFSTYLWFLYDDGIGEYEDDKDVSPSGCITFLTIHQSKGLEFPVVLIDSLGNVPKKKNDELMDKIKTKYMETDNTEIEEDTKFYDFWRLFYTGFSRAESLLVLTCEEKDGTYKCPSKYLKPICNDLPKYTDVDFEGLKLNDIKISKVKDTYSFTSCIEIYNRCAKQYQFFHELEFAEVKKGSKLYGTIVHETIEDIHKAYINGNSSTVNNVQIAKWLDINYKTLSKQLFSYLTEKQRLSALNEVMNYYKYQKNELQNVRDAEVDVSLVRDKYIMKGTVDLIKGKGDTVELIDFKSMKKPDMVKDKLIIDTYRQQLEVYAYLVEKYHNVKKT